VKVQLVQCSLAVMYKYFIYTNLFNLQCSKTGSSKFLQNVGIHVSSYVAPHSVRVQSNSSWNFQSTPYKEAVRNFGIWGGKVLLVLIIHPNSDSVYIYNQESIYTSHEYLNIFWNINYAEYKGEKKVCKICRSRHKWCFICAVYKLLIQVFVTGIRRTTKV